MNPYDQYKKNAVLTASPERILIMLYDGAINFLNVAKRAIEEKQIELAHNNIVKAQKILQEFMNTLDMDANKEVAENLLRLYDYLYHTLVQANIKKDISKVDEVIEHLRVLKETWEQAIRISAKESGGEEMFDDDDNDNGSA